MGHKTEDVCVRSRKVDVGGGSFGDAARAGSTCVGLTCNTIGRRGAGIPVNRPSLTLATGRVPRGGGVDGGEVGWKHQATLLFDGVNCENAQREFRE